MCTSKHTKQGYVNQPSAQGQHSKIPPPDPVSSVPPNEGLPATIELAELKQSAREQEDGSTRITNSQYLTSYNWEDMQDDTREYHGPTIFIPGEPPVYTPRAEQLRLGDDIKGWMRGNDTYSSRFAYHPLEPMFQAIAFENPYFPLEGVDIVTCRLTLEDLLGFVRGVALPFLILVRVDFGKEVFLQRTECNIATGFPERLQALLEQDPHPDHYNSFLEACTSWSPEVERCEGHQRIMSYGFGGMNLLVRCRVDGYLPDQNLSPGPRHRPFSRPTHEHTAGYPGSLSGGPSHTYLPIGSRFEAIKKGRHIPQSALFDLRTKSIDQKSTALAERLPRLWLGQVPNLLVACHKDGLFDSTLVSVVDAKDSIKNWETDNQKTLAVFASLLKRLVSIARKHGSFEIHYQGGSHNLELKKAVSYRRRMRV